MRSEPIWRGLAGQRSEDYVLDVAVGGFDLHFLIHEASVEELAIALVVRALGGGEVALEGWERVACVFEHVRDDAAFGGGIGQAEEHVLEGGGFEAGDALNAPAGLDHLIHEKRLVLAGGNEVGGQALGEAVEVGLVLVGEDGEGGGESVLRAVMAGGGFAWFGTRAGAELGVFLIGCGLRGRCHVAISMAGEG